MDGKYYIRYLKIRKPVVGDMHIEARHSKGWLVNDITGTCFPPAADGPGASMGPPALHGIENSCFLCMNSGVFIAGSDCMTWESICGGWWMNRRLFQSFGDEDR